MKALLCIASLFASTITFSQNLRSGGALKPEQAIMDVRHYTIALTVDPTNQSIQGYTIIKFNFTAPSNTIVLDFWHGLTTEKVTVNNKPAEFTHSDKDILTVTGKSQFNSGNYE